MPKSSVPELQDKLFRSLGIENDVRGGKGGRGQASRKDQRKANRVQKRTNVYSRGALRQASAQSVKPSKGRQPAKRSSNKVTQAWSSDDELSDGDFDVDENGDDIGKRQEDDDDSIDDLDDRGPEEPVSSKSSRNKASSSAKDKLAHDDAEVEDYERKLGIKKGRKSLPQAFKDDGLDELMGDLGGDGASDESSEEATDRKRKSEYDNWLAAKRQKTGTMDGWSKKVVSADDMEEDDSDALEGLSDEEDEGDGDGDQFEDEGVERQDADSFVGFDEVDGAEEEMGQSKPKTRENPYVAPSTGAVVAKYVPPSLRRAHGAQGDAQQRLRKQSQGLINRLTDANILSIVKAVEELYQRNARGDVTEALTDVILAQVCKPEALPDQFFVLTGGFSAAVYKIVGLSFGSHLVRRVVKDFGEEYERASAVQNDESAIPKEPSNLLTFLSQLYVFEVVRCRIIFDYMERLMGDLTELNVELLLRLCRNGGRLLRRDDPQSLKKVAGSLSKSVSRAGSDVSVRTKFMVETIDDLKNRKAKGKGLDSAVVSEQVVKMKKHIGELKSQSRRLEGTTPMGIDLNDVLNADTRGKWWLVGASVPQVGIKGKARDVSAAINDDAGSESVTPAKLVDDEDMDFVLPDYPKKARSQGLTLPSQVAIFSALMTGMNAESGWRQISNLGLKKDDKRDVARVLVQCVGSEAEYNPYYAGVAGLACRDGKLRFAFQARLWQIFRAMGESLFGEEADDADADSSDALRFQDERRINKVAKFYAELIAQGSLGITVLKPLDIPEMEPLTRRFIEALLLSLLQECKSRKAEKEDARVSKVFKGARAVPKLATGLEWFTREKLRKSKMISSKQLKKLDEVRAKALLVLQKEDSFEDMED